LIRASAGLNLALDYLPGSITFDPAAETVEAELASSVVWFDALVTNVDRTARNTNMLMWHRRLWLIDHGAALYFHHSWDNYLARSRAPFPKIKEHVLLPSASLSEGADAHLAARATVELIKEVLNFVPDEWLAAEPRFASAKEHRAAYAEYLLSRLHAPRDFVREAADARAVSI
jgi:hypothetical protein